MHERFVHMQGLVTHQLHTRLLNIGLHTVQELHGQEDMRQRAQTAAQSSGGHQSLLQCQIERIRRGKLVQRIHFIAW